MSIIYVNPNLPPSEKIERVNRQTLELNGKESEGRFDKYEIDNIYEQICIDRKFKRRVNVGSTLTTYLNWAHYSEQTGYSIWKCPVEDFAHNTKNELYFSDDGAPVDNIGALCEYEGVPTVETDVPVLLAMTSSEILARSWKWCYYGGYVYLTIRNSGNENYEGDYYITWQSTDTLKQNFFVYNHQAVANYEDSTYEYNYVCAANYLLVTDAGDVDGYDNPYILYTGGNVLIHGTIYNILSSELLMELGTINYIYVNHSGVVTSNTTGWPDICVPMTEVVCDSDGILSITDKRSVDNTMDNIHQASFTIFADVTWDNQSVPIWVAPKDESVTIVQISIAVRGTNPLLDYNIEERQWGALAHTGTNIFASKETVDSNGEDETEFANSVVSAKSHLLLTTPLNAETGTVDLVTGVIYYRKNQI